MLTNDKKITTPSYWDKVYRGENNDAKVDASNTKRPAKVFDRFGSVADYATRPAVLGVGSGHAHIEKRIKASRPGWQVIASDQSTGAMGASSFVPYWIVSAYSLPLLDYGRTKWDTVICAQAMEYMEYPEHFIREARRVARYLLVTLPIGEMEKWSQLRIYTMESARELFEQFGEIEIFGRQGDLLLIKVKFNFN